MYENMEIIVLIGGFLVTNAAIVVAIARFWSLPDRVNDLEENMGEVGERLANMEGSMQVLIRRTARKVPPKKVRREISRPK